VSPFKDLSELHNAAVDSGRPDMFETVLQAAIWQAELHEPNEDDLFKSDSQGTQESDLNKCLPFFTVGQLKEQADGSQEEGWLCPLFMKRGEITLFGGESKKSGKTTFYMYALKATHDGTPFMGMPTIATKSVVLTEQGNNLLDATRRAGIKDNDGIYIVPFREVSREQWPSLITKAVETCKAVGAKILVVDTFGAFARLRGSDENLSGEILERMEPVLEAARVHNLHVSLLHHTGKDGELRGSSAFTQDPDAIWVLKRPVGDHAPNVRALEGLGRHDSVNTTFNLKLEDSGYYITGTNGQVESQRARSELLKFIPEGRANAVRRTATLDTLAKPEGSYSKATLQRALEDLIDRHAVQQAQVKGKGNPTVLWRSPGKEYPVDTGETHTSEDEANNVVHLFKSDSDGIQEHDLNKSDTPAPITTPEALADLAETLKEIDRIALDLETMPKPGWIWEVIYEYRSWRRSLKNKPKKERMRAQWTKFKETAYKKYAVNPETAQVRLVSLATDEINETIDASALNLDELVEILKTKTLVIHNASFDLGVLRERYGYIHEGRVLDTQLLNTILHYARDGERSELRGGKYRLPDPVKTKVLIGEKRVTMSSLVAVATKYLPGTKLDKQQQSGDWSVPELPPEMISYSLKDSRVLLPLATVLLERLEEVGMGDVVLDLEARALPGQVWMERNGLPASREAAIVMAEKYRREAYKPT
jgi:hypothetical protein